MGEGRPCGRLMGVCVRVRVSVHVCERGRMCVYVYKGVCASECVIIRG